MRKLVPKEPRSPELLRGCGFSLNLCQEAGQLISPRSNLSTPRHSRMYGFIQPSPWNQAVLVNSLLHKHPWGTDRPWTKPR